MILPTEKMVLSYVSNNVPFVWKPNMCRTVGPTLLQFYQIKSDHDVTVIFESQHLAWNLLMMSLSRVLVGHFNA